MPKRRKTPKDATHKLSLTLFLKCDTDEAATKIGELVRQKAAEIVGVLVEEKQQVIRAGLGAAWKAVGPMRVGSGSIPVPAAILGEL